MSEVAPPDVGPPDSEFGPPDFRSADTVAQAKARRRRSIAIAVALGVFVILVFIVTIARMKGHVADIGF
jgi:hypothetical protein